MTLVRNGDVTNNGDDCIIIATKSPTVAVGYSGLYGSDFPRDTTLRGWGQLSAGAVDNWIPRGKVQGVSLFYGTGSGTTPPKTWTAKRLRIRGLLA
jgi:hypothetical protein